VGKQKRKKEDFEANKIRMFNRKANAKRIGSLRKSKTLNHLIPVEEKMGELMKKYIKSDGIEFCYDVSAKEIPYFRTLAYTEWSHSLIIHPLCNELKVEQVRIAKEGQTIYDDWASYFQQKVLNDKSNKYRDRGSGADIQKRGVLVVLPGSNRLKERTCLNKLTWIKQEYGDAVWYKPHPITTHTFIGEMKDMFGEDSVLPRDINVYDFLVKADKVYTTYMSETALYAAALGKYIEPIDVYQYADSGSFYQYNKVLFENCINEKSQERWINHTFSNYRSGIFNPEVDRDWEHKIEKYFEYIMGVRSKYKTWFIDGKEKYRAKQNI
jgi:hypothetical protein